MTVLVGYASKHGSTLEIADAIAEELSRRGLNAVALPIDGRIRFSGFSAAVLGSAVYMGKWMPEAKSAIDYHQEELRALPVWLFSSGPVGDPDKAPALDDNYVEQLMATTNAREHRLFFGKLDPGELGFGEKLAVRVVGAPSGDFRDWDSIRDWAGQIATALKADQQEALHSVGYAAP
jgi:menaquinone-dependent protoporphyrinogen oxidase